MEVLRIKPQGFDLGGNFLENPLNHLMPPSVLYVWLVIINLQVSTILLNNMSTSWFSDILYMETS